jgi:hypothetical protein
MSAEGSALRSNPVAYDLEDLLALSRLVPRTGLAVFRIAVVSIVILFVFVIVAEAWALTGIVDWPSIITALIFALMIILLTNRRVRAWLWLRVARRSPLHAAHSFEVTPGGLRVGSPKFTSEIPWTTFYDVKLADERLFVFMTKRLAYIIPRRAFDTEQEFASFAAAARHHWTERHRL